MLLLIVGCAPPASPPVAPTPAETGPDLCRVNPGGTTTRDTVRVASPSHEADRLIFRQRHISPVRLDCQGRLRPGFATAWSADSGGRFWTLQLDSTLDAPRIAAAWRSGMTASAVLQPAGVEAVLALDAHRLAVILRDAYATLPPVLADPGLGVERRATSLVFQPLPAGADARDALDRGADLLETADPSLLEYASASPDFLVAPLPWSRVYVLLLPPGSTGFESLVEGDSAAFRRALARDAVQGEAREATAPFSWEPRPACGSPPAATTAGSSPAGAPVLYFKEDPVARSLAERVVALSATPGATARGLDSTALTTALAAGRGAAFVLSLPRIALVPCREMAAWPAGAMVVPLVETRSRLIVRRDVPPLQVDWDGAVWVEPSP
jgi:hypothetical protein